MGVDQPAAERVEHGRADDLHEPGRDDQVGLVLGDRGGQRAVPGAAVGVVAQRARRRSGRPRRRACSRPSAARSLPTATTVGGVVGVVGRGEQRRAERSRAREQDDDPRPRGRVGGGHVAQTLATLPGECAAPGVSGPRAPAGDGRRDRPRRRRPGRPPRCRWPARAHPRRRARRRPASHRPPRRRQRPPTPEQDVRSADPAEPGDHRAPGRPPAGDGPAPRPATRPATAGTTCEAKASKGNRLGVRQPASSGSAGTEPSVTPCTEIDVPTADHEARARREAAARPQPRWAAGRRRAPAGRPPRHPHPPGTTTAPRTPLRRSATATAHDRGAQASRRQAPGRAARRRAAARRGGSRSSAASRTPDSRPTPKPVAEQRAARRRPADRAQQTDPDRR